MFSLWARKRGVASKEAGLCQFSSSVVIPTNGGRRMFNFVMINVVPQIWALVPEGLDPI